MKRNRFFENIKLKVASVLCVMVLVGMVAETAYAKNMVSFSKTLVDSNSYTYITSSTMTQSKTYAEVKVTNIFKADGKSSDYKYVMIKATSNGTPVKVKKGDTWTKVAIPQENQFAGMQLNMYAQGNNPALDCRITGYWLVY